MHVFEPSRLMLVWHHSDANSGRPRTRRVVGELVKDGDNVVFNYLKGTSDFDSAVDEGFLGFPAFNVEAEGPFPAGNIFIRRLPPKSRKDFKEYLEEHGLPVDFSGSEFSLLSYTGAKLASDTFELCPDLSQARAPLDFYFEVAGVNYNLESIELVGVGEPVSFRLDSNNPYDSTAVQVIHRGQLIGFVGRPLSAGFSKLLTQGSITASILRTSSYKGKNRVFVFVQYR